MSLGELRQAILAVYLGNPRFTPEEQLRANYQAHEYEGVQELSRWLQAARLTDAQRVKEARWQVTACPSSVCASTKPRSKRSLSPTIRASRPSTTNRLHA
jgi:DNA gyrase inhibitor GyrI